VAVALEPMKQGLIDSEILESVPKTMKTKAQFLLKRFWALLSLVVSIYYG
jgi:hypothetical protein